MAPFVPAQAAACAHYAGGRVSSVPDSPEDFSTAWETRVAAKPTTSRSRSLRMKLQKWCAAHSSLKYTALGANSACRCIRQPWGPRRSRTRCMHGPCNKSPNGSSYWDTTRLVRLQTTLCSTVKHSSPTERPSRAAPSVHSARRVDGRACITRRAPSLSDAEEDMRFELGLSRLEAKRVVKEARLLAARVRSGAPTMLARKCLHGSPLA